MDSIQLNFFQKTLVKAYYYLVIVDGKVDPKELTFGAGMIETEDINRDEFDDLLDSFSTESSEEIKASLIGDIEGLDKPEQYKIVAYMSSLADADGMTDITESNFIHDICYELQLDFKEMIRVRQQLRN